MYSSPSVQSTFPHLYKAVFPIVKNYDAGKVVITSIQVKGKKNILSIWQDNCI